MALSLAWCAPHLRDNFLLARAVQAFQDGYPGDALLAAEAACRRHPEMAIPALLRATILQAVASPVSVDAWCRAWRRDPQTPHLQDCLLQAWLARGDTGSVLALAPALLPGRCRDGNHASLLRCLQAAGGAPAGACWSAGAAIEGMLFGAGSAAGTRLLLIDAHTQRQYEVDLAPAPAGARFRLLPPHPDGVWSLALAAHTVPLPGSPLVFAPATPPRAGSPSTHSRRAPLTVLIPVYRGLAQVQACVTSVLTSLPSNRSPARLLLIDDASPDPALSAWLDTLAADARVTLLRNRYNLGFIESVNRGLRQLERHDVLLLNADTLVHGDWLDRLRAALYSAPDIAAVTPWSNNGEISSFPTIAKAAPAPDPAGLRRLDNSAAALRRAGQTGDVEVPSCCGFAMLMRGSVLAAIGTLDGATLQRGYGEEVDWCLRARAAGYRHLVATGVFVAHVGGVSFGHEKHLRVRQNRAILATRYPTYYPEYQRFLREDPLAQARARLASRLRKDGCGDHGGPWRERAGAEAGSEPAPALPPALASSCIRIAVWGHRTGSPQAMQILALARLIAARGNTLPPLRLLVYGEVGESLWRTGVVDAVPAAKPDTDALLSDPDLLGLSGCVALLAADASDAPAGLAQVRLDAGFDAAIWLATWLNTRLEARLDTRLDSGRPVMRGHRP